MRISGCAKHISEWRKCFQAIWLSLPGVVLCLSQEGTLLFPVYSIGFTCKTTLRTETLYLALRVGALSMPGKENDGNARLIWKEADQVKIEIEPLIHIINKST